MTLFSTRPICLGLTAFFLGLAMPQSAKAASLINFESIPGRRPTEGISINNQFDGITFSLLGGGYPVLAKVGGPAPAIAFTRDGGGQDRPKGTTNGSYFITDPKNNKQESLRVDYDKPVSTASGEILDIDENRQGKKEAWTLTAFDGSGEWFESKTFTAGDSGTGDGEATRWSFSNSSNGISYVQLDYTGSTNRNIKKIGVGFDNFEFGLLDTYPTLQSFLLNGRNGNINILEGQSVSARLSAKDIDRDVLDFYVNNRKVSTGTPSERDASASTTVTLGRFLDDGSYTQTARVRDEDRKNSQTITRTVNVRNVAPTLQGFNLSNAVINEGDSAFAELFATDPGADSISFFLNDQNIGTDTRTSGNRLVRTNLGVFEDEGTFTYTGQARDDDGGNSNIFARTLTVNNLDPIITSLTEDFTIRTNTTFNFAATATDPGINDILTFDWDFDGDGSFDDFTGSSGEWSFSKPGLYAMNLRVSDGDGGVAYGSFEAEAVPEPGSILGLLTLGALGVGSGLRKRKG
ncbi:MAG: PEP-CTERM sorting domain-containing protein [Okeania sp. SIO3B3]|nr:PEP-CTERM sorting domain-containing protein [Okeania sp. SIO3B3]